jgi:hypothetical protein
MAEHYRQTVDTSEVQRLAADYPEMFVEETEAVLRLITARLESDIVQATPRGVGGAAGLAGSMFGEVQTAGLTVSGVVGSPLAYAEVVEVGRRPGSFPPVAPIALWAQRKLGLSETEAQGAALAIARKIFWHGTEGAHMFRDTWQARKAWVTSMLESIPARIVRRLGAGEGA